MQNQISNSLLKSASFEDYMNSIDQTYDTNNLYQQCVKILEHTSNLGIPLHFQRNQQKNNLSLLVLGEVGNGKSTTLNYILWRYCQIFNNNNYNPNTDQFKSSQSATSVTQDVSNKVKGGINLIDSPGTNDPKKTMTDPQIARKIHDFLKGIMFSDGLSGILQCIMVDPSGRIKDTQIRSMSRALMSFSTMYPDFDISKSPRINVIFTNFSLQKEQAVQNFGLPLAYSNNDQQQQQDQISIQDLIVNYKEMLFQQILKEMKGVNVEQIQQKINQLLPDSNFYAFKLQDTQQKQDKEFEQIEKLIIDNINHGKWYISNQQEAAFEPVQMEYEMRDQISDHINDVITFCYDSLLQANQSYTQYSGGQVSQLIQENIQTIQQIQQKFQEMINLSPWSLQKCPQSLAQFLQKMIQRLSICFGQMNAEEIGKYNKELSQKLQEQNEQHKLEIQKQNERFQELIETSEKEKEEFNNKIFQQEQYIKEQQEQNENALQELKYQQDQQLQNLNEQHQEEIKIQRENLENQKKYLEQMLQEQKQSYEKQMQEQKQLLQQQQQDINNLNQLQQQMNNQQKDAQIWGHVVDLFKTGLGAMVTMKLGKKP